MSFSYIGFCQHEQDHRPCGVKYMLMLKNVVEFKMIYRTNHDEQGKKTKVD